MAASARTNVQRRGSRTPFLLQSRGLAGPRRFLTETSPLVRATWGCRSPGRRGVARPPQGSVRSVSAASCAAIEGRAVPPAEVSPPGSVRPIRRAVASSPSPDVVATRLARYHAAGRGTANGPRKGFNPSRSSTLSTFVPRPMCGQRAARKGLAPFQRKEGLSCPTRPTGLHPPRCHSRKPPASTGCASRRSAASSRCARRRRRHGSPTRSTISRSGPVFRAGARSRPTSTG